MKQKKIYFLKKLSQKKITTIKKQKIQLKEDKTNYDQYNYKKEGYFFADQIQIDGETIFTIPFEDQMKDENDLPKRKSRWGDRPQIRQKIQNPVIFNPLQGLKTGYGLLALTHESNKINSYFQAPVQEPAPSRWGAEYEKTFHPPLLNYIPLQISDDDFEYLIRLYRLDEINNKQLYKTKNILDDEDCRSPSPEPIYNESGKRINTRDIVEYETIQKEKHNLIEECMKINPTFVPPHDYKHLKKTKKIYLPESHAEQLKQRIIGPKGATHKSLEQQTSCKISIKGKGSGNGSRRVDNDTNDKLHVFITAQTEEQLEKATKLIDEILRGEDKKNETPYNQIAIITDYLNQDFCPKCHQTGHRVWECTAKTTFDKIEIKCQICGDKGHVTIDCKLKKDNLQQQIQVLQQIKYIQTLAN
ncbi:zinc knuckle family protein, putative [Ichthyophthirius multifiliis]|uniref:Branchpoint-bridging protein n=1 Tax=Ichthyophthirius multifiliis TaxID=5932 RepID=G0QN40_ICHMU|nr:zinc knuckle family protein, putative [Ichthyophthirius multifiliis]EGR33369.1 zinc knuckle family protein, putative [Ichthyophthirius multifiliis]|eukprot:XP_004037355.1 zinc knuckle family protein, putative [Ichthyophthirius multifiliis]